MAGGVHPISFVFLLPKDAFDDLQSQLAYYFFQSMTGKPTLLALIG